MKAQEQKELSIARESGAILVTPEVLSGVVKELLQPVMQSMAKILENNTAALEQLSSAQSVQNDRLEALERQIRLQTKVDSKQAGYLNGAIRQRSRELLSKREIEDKKAITKLGNHIRRAVLARYGISSLRDVPKHEYTVAMQQIEIWNNALLVGDVVKDARERMAVNDDQGQ